MVFDQVFIGLVLGFSFIGGLALLSCSAYAIKMHQKEMEIRELKDKLLARRHIRRPGPQPHIAEAASEEPIEVS
jgi:hypothetical protein